jgi:hypothetical protein
MAGFGLPALVIGLALVPGAAAASTLGEQTVVKIGTPASEAEAAALDVGVQDDSHGCSGGEASNNSYVHVCFVRYGDTLWVRDDESNGRYAAGEISYYDGGSRHRGYCFSPYSHASGKWYSCGFSQADEKTTVDYRGFDHKNRGGDHYTAWQRESTS